MSVFSEKLLSSNFCCSHSCNIPYDSFSCEEHPYLDPVIAQTSIELSPGFDAIKREHRILPEHCQNSDGTGAVCH